MYRSVSDFTSRKLRFLEPLEIQRRVTLTTSPGRSFFYLVEKLSRDGLKPETIDLMAGRASFIRRYGSLSLNCYVRLAGIAQDTAIVTVGVERSLLSRLFVERAWYTQALQELLVRVDGAMAQI